MIYFKAADRSRIKWHCKQATSYKSATKIQSQTKNKLMISYSAN